MTFPEISFAHAPEICQSRFIGLVFQERLKLSGYGHYRSFKNSFFRQIPITSNQTNIFLDGFVLILILFLLTYIQTFY